MLPILKGLLLRLRIARYNNVNELTYWSLQNHYTCNGYSCYSWKHVVPYTHWCVPSIYVGVSSVHNYSQSGLSLWWIFSIILETIPTTDNAISLLIGEISDKSAVDLRDEMTRPTCSYTNEVVWHQIYSEYTPIHSL